MDAALRAVIEDGIRQAQSLVGETVTLGDTDYTCTASGMVKGTLESMQGGLVSIMNVSICVMQADLSLAPAINSTASFRGFPFRVNGVDDGETFWEIFLIQEFA